MQHHQPRPLESLDYYRNAVEHLLEFSRKARQRFEAAHGAGDLAAAHEALSTLEARTEEFKKLRSTLTPHEIFIAKYSVEVHGPHEVSFTIPQGVSRIEMLREAHGIIEKESCLVSAAGFMSWEKAPAFTSEVVTPERIRIVGFVAGGDRMTRAEQEVLLQRRNLSMPASEDLAAAFAAYYVATEEPLLKWYERPRSACSYIIRSQGGALMFMKGAGIGGMLVDDALCATNFTGIGVSARIESTAKSSATQL